jgi:SOS-response transcriptional repressor LexA
MDGARIRAKRKELGLTQKQIADYIGVKPPTIVQWDAGDTRPNGKNLLKLAEILKVSPSWITTGKTSRRFPESNVTHIDHPVNLTPLISWVAAGEYCESPDNFEPGDAEDWKLSPFKQGPLSYCLRVSGPSMWPEYPDGCLIFVDPDREAIHGKDVVVRTPDGNHAFKRLQITPDGTYLMALNPDWQERIIKIPKGSVICGVVIGMMMEK